MGYWSDTARRVIREVHDSLPADATLEQRMKAIDEAYPFGPRQYSPYKTWLKARRDYLCRYGYQPKGKPRTEVPLFESPLDRAKRRAMEAR